MKVLWLVLALLLLSWHAWAGSCPPDPDQTGEWIELELTSVSVDGVPAPDLEQYSQYRIRLVSDVDPYEVDGLTRSCDFKADPLTVDGIQFFERYAVHDDLEDLW